jgi:type IV pilus assembly protein PilA
MDMQTLRPGGQWGRSEAIAYRRRKLMLQASLRRLREARAAEVEGEEIAEGGFTLIELMVVLLIIAILLAIAIPTFLGVTNTAGDRAAQSNLTNALTEAKALYQVNQAYSQNNTAYTSTAFQSQAPEFTWTAGNCATSTAGNCISFAVGDASTVGDGQGLALAAWSSKTNTCWYAVDLENTPAQLATTDTVAFIQGSTSKNVTLTSAGVWYGKNVVTGGPCTASTALNPPAAAGWATSYSGAKTVN